MDMVERVAAAVLATEFIDGDCLQDYLDMMSSGGGQEDGRLIAKAAIRAMLEGLEPFAYRYFIKPPEAGMGKTIWRTCRDPHLIDDGWTETPLYDLSALKEVVG